MYPSPGSRAMELDPYYILVKAGTSGIGYQFLIIIFCTNIVGTLGMLYHSDSEIYEADPPAATVVVTLNFAP
jgi:hypothetical protein